MMMMKAMANSPAAPSPWIPRNTMSCVIPSPRSGRGPKRPAMPHSAEPVRNSTTAESSMALRLYMSESLP